MMPKIKICKNDLGHFYFTYWKDGKNLFSPMDFTTYDAMLEYAWNMNKEKVS